MVRLGEVDVNLAICDIKAAGRSTCADDLMAKEILFLRDSVHLDNNLDVSI